jgi:hypothetical protein
MADKKFRRKNSHKKHVKASSPGVGYTDSDPQGTQHLLSANIEQLVLRFPKGDLNAIARWFSSTKMVPFFDRIF